jgi:SAM-dependent methyltransferase
LRLSRETANRVRFVLDELLPPALRDARWFARALFKVAYGERAGVFLDFKRRARDLSELEFGEVYRQVQEGLFERETDLNAACFAAVERDVIGPSVLDAGCGSGTLARALSPRCRVTAVDIALARDRSADGGGVRYGRATVERLPFRDQSFDTVVSTHTLEHVRDVGRALAEIRRVARRRVILVVPRQRYYRYTFDLHLNFFPDQASLRALVGNTSRSLEELGGDWYYVEDR